MMIFADAPMKTILATLRARVAQRDPGTILVFAAPDPDRCPGCYAGETFEYEGRSYRHHSWHAWARLAQLLDCRMLTPQASQSPLVTVRFQVLDLSHSFHDDTDDKYTAQSHFGRIHKLEEPDFLYHYQQALDEVSIRERKRILDLGVSRGDELLLIDAMTAGSQPEMIGVDLDATALAVARNALPYATFHEHDINDLDALRLGRFDLLISIGTLQSPAIETKTLIMQLVQNHLDADAAIILGWPAARWIDGELLPGPRVPHYPFSEMGLALKDIHWIKKYLQQHRYRVRIFGQSYWFVVATRIGTTA